MNKIIALWLAVALLACATLHTMTGSFATCAKADLGQQVTVGAIAGGLEAVVAQIALANTPALEADALTVIAQVGVDAFDCAKAAVSVALNAKVVTTSGSATVGATAPSGLDRLDAVSTAYRKAHAS